jgi:protein-S-isoprenylcysteine O-methyltransferase Ste14
MMKASNFEFRNRAAIFGVIYGITFSMLWFDHVPVGAHAGAWLARHEGWSEDAGVHAAFVFGAAMMVVAGLIRTWGSAYLGLQTVHDKSVHVEALHADGPYRFVRNPLYLGNLVMTLGMGILAPKYAYPVQVVLIIIFVYRLIGREEAEFTASQGETYVAFLRAVPRMIPAFSPRLPGGGPEPDWKTGWATEAWFWSFTAGMIGFAITLKIECFYAGLVAAPFVGMAAEKLTRRNRRAAEAKA